MNKRQKEHSAAIDYGPLIGLHFKICSKNDTERKKEWRHINVLVLVREGRPGISAVTRSNETHNVLFQPKYHIHKHNYSYYLSRGVLYCAAGYTQYACSNKAQHFLSPP